MASALDRLFRLLPDGALAAAERVYGALLLRVADHGPGRFLVAAGHRLLARGLGRVAGVTGLSGELPPVELAHRTMKKFFLPILDEPEARPSPEDTSWTFSFKACPYGLAGGGADRDMCHAIMNLEEELMRQVGGELVIEQRIAEGAPMCRFTVRGGPPVSSGQ